MKHKYQVHVLIFDHPLIVMGFTPLLSFEWKHVINEGKMEQKQQKTMKNDWKRRNSLGSGEMVCVCEGVNAVYVVWRGGGRGRRRIWLSWVCGVMWHCVDRYEGVRECGRE